MTTAAEASSILGDTIASFNKAALAIAAVEEKARKDVARIASDLDELRRERDTAIRDIHATQITSQSWQSEAETWKTCVGRLEVSLKQQREITESYKREAQQWKDHFTHQEASQSLQVAAHARQEEKFTREAQELKEQYRQAEKERQRLASRLEELLLKTSPIRAPVEAHHHGAPLPSSTTKASSSKSLPPPAYETIEDASPGKHTSKRPRRTAPNPDSQASHPAVARGKSRLTVYSDDEAEADPTEYDNGQSRSRAVAQNTSRSSTAQRPHAGPSRGPRAEERAQTQTHAHRPPELIRRVKAVISVPVKEEDDMDEDSRVLGGGVGVESAGLWDSGGPPSASTTTPTSAFGDEDSGEFIEATTGGGRERGARTSGRAVKEDGRRRREGDGGDEEREDDAVSQPEASVMGSAGRTMPKRRATTRQYVEDFEDDYEDEIIGDGEDEEDDELMIGAEDDQEIYGTTPVVKRGRGRPRKGKGDEGAPAPASTRKPRTLTTVPNTPATPKVAGTKRKLPSSVPDRREDAPRTRRH